MDWGTVRAGGAGAFVGGVGLLASGLVAEPSGTAVAVAPFGLAGVAGALVAAVGLATLVLARPSGTGLAGVPSPGSVLAHVGRPGGILAASSSRRSHEASGEDRADGGDSAVGKGRPADPGGSGDGSPGSGTGDGVVSTRTRGPPRSRGRGSGYRRDDDSDPLENDVRRAIDECIERSPGTYPAKVVDATGVPLSTVRYHLRVLVEEGRVKEETIGGRRRLYPVDSEHLALEAALEDEATAAVLWSLARSGPATVSELAERLDRAPSTLSHHLSRLESDDLVVRERDGVSVVTRLHPAVAGELDDPGEGSGDRTGTGTPGATATSRR